MSILQLKDNQIIFINYKMYIRIEFKDVESDNTRDTQCLFFGSPSGTCLSSLNACRLSSKEIREVVGDSDSVVFWYLDVDILNKHYFGVRSCLNDLVRYPGVGRVDVLPIEGHYNSFIGKFDELCTILMRYIGGV